MAYCSAAGQGSSDSPSRGTRAPESLNEALSEYVSASPPSSLLEGSSIAFATIDDIDAYASHIVAHLGESGREGMPRFALNRSTSEEDVRKAFPERWQRNPDEPNWGRAWLLRVPISDHVVGHIELRGGKTPQEMHRAYLSMGLRRSFTGRGLGRRLLDTAVDWARTQKNLEWIDLGVFAENETAIKLYKRYGFMETGFRRDAFRLEDGAVVDEILMSLRLGADR